MSTLVENGLLLLVLLVVYTYRPQAGQGRLLRSQSDLEPTEDPVRSRATVGNRREASQAPAPAIQRGEAAVVRAALPPLESTEWTPVKHKPAARVERDDDARPEQGASTDGNNSAGRPGPSKLPSPRDWSTGAISFLSPTDGLKGNGGRAQTVGPANRTSSGGKRAHSVPAPAAAAAAHPAIGYPFRSLQTTLEEEEEEEDRKPGVVSAAQAGDSASQAGRALPIHTQPATPKSTVKGKATATSVAASTSMSGRAASVASTSRRASTPSAMIAANPSRERSWRWFKGKSGQFLENGEPAWTAWFKSESSSEISAPPDFSTSPLVRTGDVFLHCTPNNTYQLWVWECGPQKAVGPRWVSVPLGHRRWDGRKLTVTSRRREPSWVV
ncbi:hypothetical protein FKP32DRAFT_1679510 [Trametes sanguinea]|nr:hypothetical protein FKP32DRAFT_1679510 [Trametes sanguinea]